MTNNRKPVDEVRLSWDAEAAFKRIEGQELERREDGNTVPDAVWFDKQAMKAPYTPPPNVAAWLQAQADKPKAGRDIESLMRYHEAHKRPVGYWEDAPRGKPFRAGKSFCPGCMAEWETTGPEKHKPGCKMAAAPTPPQCADGGQPLPSASTKPHGKDVDTADGPWPRYFIPTDPSQSAACIFVDAHTSDVFWRGFVNKDRRLVTHNALPKASDKRWSEVNVGVFAQWLEQNGHADAAAQLRGKARDDVATGGGRVWMNTMLVGRTRVCIQGRQFLRASTGEWRADSEDVVTAIIKSPQHWREYTELHGPERDAIIVECMAAMGLM